MDPTKGRAWKRAQQAAKKYANNPKQAETLHDKALHKLKAQKARVGSVWGDFLALLRMLKAWATGRYRQLPYKSLLLLLGALAYFVNPFDLIPDFILTVGFLDDVSVLGFVLLSIKKDVDNFLAWEQQNQAESGRIAKN